MAETPATTTTAAPRPIARSKRERYSSIACEECRSRKLKCRTSSSVPGGHCDRCLGQGLQCKITRPQRGLRSHVPRPLAAPGVSRNDEPHGARFMQMEDELSLLRRQVARLTSSYSHQSPSPPEQQCHTWYQREPGDAVPFRVSQVQTRVEPHFVGTTRPTFTLNIAKASLELMGVPVHNDNSSPAQIASPPPPQHKACSAASIDPLLRLSTQEVQRLFAVFQDEIASSYPAFYCWDVAAKIPDMVAQFSSGVLTQRNATRLQKEAQFLRIALATALVLEQGGRSKLAQELFTSVEQETCRIYAHSQVDLVEIRTMAIMATYHFHCDEELYAWRIIGVAGRLVLEMGLHRRQSLMTNFPNQTEREEALAVFWCVYALDRRWSLGTGLSFIIVDRDVDPELPDLPLSQVYLRSLVDYARLCSKVWEALPQFGSTSISLSPAQLLDHQIQDWSASMPHQLRLSTHFYPLAAGSPPTCELDHPTLTPSRAARNVRSMMYLNANHLRSLVNRHHVLSSSAISANPQQARLVVQIARDSIHVIVQLSKETDIYARLQSAYNHHLVSALAIVLLATCHAPEIFAAACRQDFADAVNLVRGFSETSIAGHRLWKSMCGLVSAVSALGLGYNRAEQQSQAYHSGDEYQTPRLLPQPQQQMDTARDEGMREFFDSSLYNTEAQPDMRHVSTDLMGLFDAFWHGNTEPDPLRTGRNIFGSATGFD
ncbi:hypothetical protein QBC41DRAFT_385678 [Cercophora samala]|uniref:Zn(2)-C6 fungal-type domain-containing protein n=1 Tax=Cercophora samala TaxID=330535 RepID=A0AA40DFE1_9PEZI|nr:hypothetical protein QBC41DRAFT_385678 [Cercophora samala]